jgi:hypothetical protein
LCNSIIPAQRFFCLTNAYLELAIIIVRIPGRSGIGFTRLSATLTGTLRALLPTAGPHRRAGLFSAFYLQSYLAFSLPAVAAGLSVPLIGLSTAAYLYGAAIILLAVTSMIASLRTAVDPG